MARLDFVHICCLDDVQSLLPLADRAAENDEAIIDQSIHERRMIILGALVPDLTRGVRAWAVD